MIAATRYPAFSRNFEDEQDYAEAAVSAARKANPLPSGLSLAPTLRWKRELNRGSVRFFLAVEKQQACPNDKDHVLHPCLWTLSPSFLFSVAIFDVFLCSAATLTCWPP